ncbi:calcineurin-like phosphoesterase C-terminal domain-containing protein [Kineococcus sp. SYSU DK004]|uniref:calcineurin-like phosphoesterase C-terminal domain-containing protein n=1 Tax=Kineococcus sp. SYSU DK004 TaxID=3383125 RepID=UPI003D7CADC6
MRPRTSPRTLASAAALLVGAGALVAAVPAVSSPEAPAEPTGAAYVADVEVLREAGATTSSAGEQVLRGTVFEDGDRDGRSDGETGVPGVAVSNGRDVVVTDERGRYELPVFEGMTAFVTQPAGWQVPVDADGVARFHYTHLPNGTPQDLRFGGLEPTGPLPSAVNFPLVRGGAAEGEAARCTVTADFQTYSGRELGFARDGLMADLARSSNTECGALLLGDVAGDDLGLYPRIKEVLSLAGVPLRFVPGNHDLDLDSTDPEHSMDTFRQHMGPETFSYDVGDTHFVALNNVKYPCTPEDNADGARPHCDDPENSPRYNGELGERQLEWLENDLALVPEDKLVVVATHIPLVSFADAASTQHSTRDVQKLYELLEGRKALSMSGHTHSTERMVAGDSYAGWQEAVGVSELPFPNIVAGAPSGDWYSGDLDVDGRPMALQRDGARPGYLTLDLQGGEFRDTWHTIGESDDEQLAVAVNSPRWREWFDTLNTWADERAAGDHRTPPPVNVNDLGDPGVVTRDDLANRTWLTANVWYGSSDTTVEVSVDGGEPVAAERTQQADGEAPRVGAEYADPAAATRQLQVARYGFESTSGDDYAQGYELYAGSTYGPGPAQPGNNVADRTTHLWRYQLPADLALGVHSAEVTVTDHLGRTYSETHTFEVREEVPQQGFRTELFEDGEED